MVSIHSVPDALPEISSSQLVSAAVVCEQGIMDLRLDVGWRKVAEEGIAIRLCAH